MGHTFYNTEGLSLEQKKRILSDAKKLSTKWKVDKLDCSVSWQRRPADITFAKAKQMLDDKSHFTIVNRSYDVTTNFGEIGFRHSAEGVDTFLWILLSIEDMETIVNKYNLTTKYKSL